jgi:hypothetical protein
MKDFSGTPPPHQRQRVASSLVEETAPVQRREAQRAGRIYFKTCDIYSNSEGNSLMKIDGACSCGTIKIEGEADPEKTQVCHCTDCQTGTGSAFRVSIPVPGATFKMTGVPTIYLKTTAESGNPRAQAFCPKCGSPIYSTTQGDGVQPSYTVRVGILRQRDQLTPRRQNWFRSARSWVTALAAVPKNEKQAS